MELGREDLSLLPLEGLGRGIVGVNEGVDGLVQLPGGEAGSLQGATAEVLNQISIWFSQQALVGV